MHLPPYVASQVAGEHHRHLRAEAQRHRRAGQFAALARASRRAERRMRRAYRRALQLNSGL